MEIDWKKQYEEVLAKARAGKNLGEIFPELKESEDGKIREEIVSFIRAFWVDHRYSVPQTSKWLDWLEKKKDSPMPEDTVIFQKGVEEGRRLEREDTEKKRGPIIETYQRSWYTEGYYDGKLKKEPRWIIKNQGICTEYEENPKYGQSLEEEQKPVEWSDEEKRKLNRIYAILGQAADTHAYSTSCRLIGDKEAVELQDFLRSIAKPQIPGWSEEDDRHRLNCLSYFSGITKSSPYYEDYLWLKSLKNRVNSPSWKPSAEQMEALLSELPIVRWSGNKVQNILESLYDDLKKLM